MCEAAGGGLEVFPLRRFFPPRVLRAVFPFTRLLHGALGGGEDAWEAYEALARGLG